MKAAATMLQQAGRKFFAEKDRLQRAVAVRVVQNGVRRGVLVRRLRSA